MPRKWLKDTEENLPTRRLYLNLLEPLEENEDSMKYDFRFLTEEEAAREDEHTKWYKK